MPEQAQTVVIKVGMHCEGCRRKVKKALSKIPGIEELKVDLKEQKVTIRGAVDIKRVMSKLARTGKVNEILTNTPSDKSKDSPAPPTPPAAAAAAAGTPQAAAAAAAAAAGAGGGTPAVPVTLATSAAATEAAILKDMPIKPLVWIDAPDFLSDENPNACSIM